MEFFDLAKKRYSMLHYDTRRIEAAVLDKILEAGMLAPTACNNQPQCILIIRTPERKEKLEKICKSGLYYDTALLVCYDSDTVWRNPRDRCYENYNAGEQDASIVAASMMFQAEELGVHSLWIRGFDSQDVIDAFDLPANHVPVMMLALGYPGEKSHPAHLHSKRKPLSETVREL